MIVVAGALANKPLNGGEAWVRLTWALAAMRLGHEVHLLEQIAPDACLDAGGRRVAFRDSQNAAFFQRVVQDFGLKPSATLICGDGEATLGLSLAEVEALMERADLLLNISGHLRIEPLLERARLKAYVDLDPVFTQIWHAQGDASLGVDRHDAHFTVGTNIGSSRCTVPTNGIHWRPIAPPVLLDRWPPTPAAPGAPFTTVATWRNPYGPLEHAGIDYGLKHHEFRKVISLPTRAAADFEVALDVHPGDRGDLDALVEHGWRIRDPRVVAADPASFRSYVAASGAEFSVAQGAYVATCSGWLSDRTAAYLASAKPALVQDTGLSSGYPTGEGLVTFRTLDEALEGVERITTDYEAHSRAARAFAERHLDSDRVVGGLLAEVDLGP